MSRVIRTPNEDCNLHRALMNTGYMVCRRNYYYNDYINYGYQRISQVITYYVPAVDLSEAKFDSNGVMLDKETPGCVRDWAAEPRYVFGKGGNAYPAEFVEMYPYSYG